MAIIGFALLIMAGSWLAIESQISRERATKIEDVMRENANLARAFSEHTSRTLGYVNEIAIAVQKQFEVQGERFDIKTFYSELQPNPAVLRNLLITDASGMVVLSTDPTPRISLADREHVRIHQTANDGKLFISKPVLARVNKQWSIIATRRASKPDGSFVGVVGVAIDPAYFSNFYKDLDLGRHGVVTLVGTDGIVRARLARDNQEIGQDVGQAEIFLNSTLPASAGAKASSSIARSTLDKIDRIYSWRSMPDYPLIIYVGTSMNDAMANVDVRARGYRIAVSSACAVISLIAVLLLLLSMRQRRAEVSIRALKNRQAAIIDRSMDAIIGVDARQHIVLFSAAAERLFQLSAAEVMGQALDRFLPERYRVAHREHMRKFIDQGESAADMGQARALLALKADGSEFPIDASISHVSTGGEQLYTVTIRDISEHKQLEQTLRALTERLQLGQRNAKMLIMDWHIARGEMVWSDSPDRICGPIAEGASLPPWATLVHPEDLDYFLAVRAKGVQTQETQTFEYRIVRTDGQIVWLRSVQTMIAGPDGSAERAIISLQDITERKLADAEMARLEAQLRESQKMEAIGTLAGGIAHDFNNIIATILGHVELARHNAGIHPDTLESLGEIRKAGRRARDLVNQILAFSRRESTHRRLVALASIVDETVRLLRATLPARITIRVQQGADLPVVLVDTTQIEQVLINLANNAAHAMHGEPGYIEFCVDTVMLDAAFVASNPGVRALAARHSGRTARLRVRDSGQGMDVATMARMFEPFFTTKPAGEGTGLGLAVVHGIVLAHEGAIIADSQPGHGSTFTVFLPIPPDAALMAPVELEEPTAPDRLDPVTRRHILYIDDDESLLLLVKRLLERRGLEVSAHSSQSEALAVLRADPSRFDLVVTDYNMPGMSGLDVAREVMLIRPGLPVVVASGFVDETLRSQAKDAGITELIFKATAVEDYCGVVERLLARDT